MKILVHIDVAERHAGVSTVCGSDWHDDRVVCLCDLNPGETIDDLMEELTPENHDEELEWCEECYSDSRLPLFQLDYLEL